MRRWIVSKLVEILAWITRPVEELLDPSLNGETE